jgi:hypothetical protein
MRRLLNWFRRRDLESGLDRELRYHIDRRVGDLIRSGLPEKEARRQAALELGGFAQVREEVRDIWLSRWLRDFLYDLRFSARSFFNSPAFTAAVVLSLALGVGATTAIYSLVDQVLLHALPVRQPERLVLVDWMGDQAANGFGSFNLMSYPICRDLQSQDRVFEGVFCRALTTVNLSTGGEHKPAAAEIVSGTYFPVLGVGAAVGRVLGNEDDLTPGASPVVVRFLEDATGRRAGRSGPQGSGQSASDDRRGCGGPGLPGHRHRRGSIALDPGVHVRPGHPRLYRFTRPPHAVDADSGAPKARRFISAGASGAATVV